MTAFWLRSAASRDINPEKEPLSGSSHGRHFKGFTARFRFECFPFISVLLALIPRLALLYNDFQKMFTGGEGSHSFQAAVLLAEQSSNVFVHLNSNYSFIIQLQT